MQMFQIGDLTFYNWKKGRSWIGGNERWEVNTFYLEKYQYCHHVGQGVRSDICQCIGQGGGSGRELLVSTPWHWHQGGSQCHCQLSVEGGQTLRCNDDEDNDDDNDDDGCNDGERLTQSYIKR